jgi:phosphotransferase system HPr (HPr) family protein
MRAAMILYEQAKKFPCALRILCGNRQADAKNMWDLLCLAAEYGSELVFEAQGPQSLEALDCLERLVTQQFEVLEKKEMSREPSHR